jgi:hypothetical protein
MYLSQQAVDILHEEHVKDLSEGANNQHLNERVGNKNGLLKNVRNALGNRLVSAGQQLFNDKQR